MDYDALQQVIKGIMDASPKTDLTTVRVYHQYFPAERELRFDLAYSPSGLSKLLTPPTPQQEAGLPAVVANLTVEDAKTLRTILDEFLTLAGAQ